MSALQTGTPTPDRTLEPRSRRHRDATVAELRHAPNDGEQRLDFQPFVAVVDGATSGFEAVLRWRRPGADDAGAWVVRHAAEVAAAWPARLRVAVKLSAAELRTPRFADWARRACDQAQLDPARLELEIAESAFIDDLAAAAAALSGLRAEGVRMALDDFGGAHSSLRALARLPLDRIKIDGGFAVEALVNPRCAAVIRAAAQLAKELGLALTGKGVETREQFELLRSAGCDETQGYFHSRPLTEAELAAALARNSGGGWSLSAPRPHSHDRA